jgi:hypothetical protein
MHAHWRAPAESARAHAVVRTRGRIEIELSLRSNGLGRHGGGRVDAEVVAWAVVQKVPRAIAYRLRLDGAASAAERRRRYRVTFAPPANAPVEADPAAAPIQSRGNFYRVQLATRRTWADDFAPEWEALRAQFEGVSVTAVVTVDDR